MSNFLLGVSAPTLVVLQPGPSTSKDASLEADAATTNFGTNINCHAIRTGGSATRRAAMQFDLSGIPIGRTIISAILSLRCSSNLGAGAVNIHRMIQSWDLLTCTWNTHNGVTPWASPGGDFDGTVYATNNPASWVSGTLYTFDITALVQGWVAPTFLNAGLIVKLGTEAGSAIGLQFASGNNATPANWPRLDILYK